MKKQIVLVIGFLFLLFKVNGQSFKGKSFTFSYAQFLYINNEKRIYEWDKKIYYYPDYPMMHQVILSWTTDSTMNLISGKDRHIVSTLVACKLSRKEKDRVPQNLLNGKYKLIGVFEKSTMRKAGAWQAFYLGGRNIFSVDYLDGIGFMAGALLYMPEANNDLKAAGVKFPYLDHLDEEIEMTNDSKKIKVKRTIRHGAFTHQ